MREFYGLPNLQSDDALRGYKQPTPEPKADSKPKSTPRKVKYPTASEMQGGSPKSSAPTRRSTTTTPSRSYAEKKPSTTPKPKSEAAPKAKTTPQPKAKKPDPTKGLTADVSDLKGIKGDRLANAISAVQKEILKRRKKRGDL